MVYSASRFDLLSSSEYNATMSGYRHKVNMTEKTKTRQMFVELFFWRNIFSVIFNCKASALWYLSILFFKLILLIDFGIRFRPVTRITAQSGKGL
jgi:hypothetical protein